MVYDGKFERNSCLILPGWWNWCRQPTLDGGVDAVPCEVGDVAQEWDPVEIARAGAIANDDDVGIGVDGDELVVEQENGQISRWEKRSPVSEEGAEPITALPLTQGSKEN